MNNDSEKNQPNINYTDKPYDLIDGAVGAGFDINLEVEKLRQIIQDKTYSLEDRLEAFEDAETLNVN